MSYISPSYSRSAELFLEAQNLFPGGVNSPVRAFSQVGGTPLFITKAKGPMVWDEDGNSYIDYVGSYGPAILGHAHPEVAESITNALNHGFSFGSPTAKETKLAKMIMELMPSIEMLRFVSSGTEACMSAIRVARGYTGRDKIIKFSGCYHGHADMLLVQAGSGAASCGVPVSPGVTSKAAFDTLVAPYNDLEAVEDLFCEYKDQIAAIIVEPIVGNCSFIRPVAGFLEGLRQICTDQKALLIFDEVMTGFRVGLSGVQGLVQCKPDITTLGKVIGGGLPIGAFGGSREIMKRVAPMGAIYQAGTLSGNPISVSCGIKTLELLREKYCFTFLSAHVKRLLSGLKQVASDNNIPFVADSEGGMFGFSFSEKSITNSEDMAATNSQIFTRFFHKMLEGGIYLAPSAYEAGFVSFAHSNDEIDKTITIASKVFPLLKKDV